ncbi:MAG TPA: hypothetical protein VER76_07400, partial [Pyrinomonadaceae bacterium]|nr:hypothetical protein [Pyrinomonadaceae bacterium]
LVFSHDAKLMASAGSDSTIKLWDVELGRERLTLKGHAGAVHALAFSHAGRVLASASGGMSLDNLLAQRAETLTADNTVRLWNADTGSQLRALTGHTEQVNAVAFSPDDKLVASGSNDGTVKLWAADTGAELRTLEWSIGTVLAVAFSPDGKVLASGHSNYILLWDVSTGRLLKRLDGHMPRGRAAAAEELFTTELVTSGLSAPACGSTDFRWVTSLSFSHDGKTLASGSKDRTAKLWDARTGALLHTLSGHDSWVTSVAFSPDDRMLASGSADTQVKMWNVASGREQISLVNIDRRDWIVVTPDGLFDGSPAAWNQLLWRFGRNNYDVRPVEIFFNEFYYPSLLAEVSAGRRPSAGQTILQKDRRQPEVKLSLAAGQVMPAEGLATRNLTVRVEVREAATDPAHAAGSGARDLRLFRNGALVRVWRGALELRDGKAVLETTLPIVAGENRLSAYAFNNDNIKSSDAALTVKGADALKRKGTAYILAIGINKYASNRRFLNLNYAVADALDFGAVLKQQEATVGNFERIEVLTLLDANATKARLLAALGQLVARAEPEDELVIFFAGHGKADGQRFFMLPHDIAVRQAGLGRAPAALPSVLARSISDRELELALEKVDVGHLLLVIDACNSGQALNADEQRRGPMNSKGLAQLAYEKGMYILTASQSYQEAAETRAQKHGLLTYALTVEGLTAGRADDAPRDGQILLREWLDYATKRVPELRAAENVELLRRQGRRRGLLLQSVAGEASPQQRARQQPRVFYRRELEDKPLVIARLAAPPEP